MTTRNPTTINGTNRQKVTTSTGVALSRRNIYMPEAAWESLQRLCHEQQCSGSKVLENLINAARGIQKETDDSNKRN